MDLNNSTKCLSGINTALGVICQLGVRSATKFFGKGSLSADVEICPTNTEEQARRNRDRRWKECWRGNHEMMLSVNNGEILDMEDPAKSNDAAMTLMSVSSGSVVHGSAVWMNQQTAFVSTVVGAMKTFAV